jgi:hypothetical protein
METDSRQTVFVEMLLFDNTADICVQAVQCRSTKYSRLSYDNWQLFRNVANSVADSGSGAFLTPASGMERNPDSGSGMNMI